MGRIVETRKLYKDTVNEITKSSENWQSFLDSSSWNFKYDFDDQVLIYAQRPDAKACAEMSEWNKKLKRWIKKGSNGIFVQDKNENSQFPFRMVFDISDTYNAIGTEYKLWDIKPEYEQEIIETLEASFGEISAKESLAQAIYLTAYNMIDDNIQDYMETIKNHIKGTKLEAMEENDIETIVKVAANSSVAYMMMTRCGINAKEYIEKQDISLIEYFNSYQVTTTIGAAISDIAEMGLREIANTVFILQKNERKRNRTFEKNQKELYADNENKNIGGIDYERNNLHKTGGLQYTKSSDDTRETTNREIRQNEVEIPKSTQEIRIYDSSNGREIGRTLNRDTGSSNEENRTDSQTNGETREDNRRIESSRPNEMDTDDEQLENDSRGNSSEGNNLQLNIYKKGGENRTTDYVVVDEKINQILSSTPYLKKYNKDIIAYFENEKDIQKRANFLKNIFNNEYTEIFVDDKRYGYKTFENGVLFWKDSFLSRNTESFVEWNELTNHFDSMILLNQLRDRFEPPKSESEQINLIDESNNTLSDFEFTQEFIDRFLQEQHQEHKFYVYEHFEKSLSTKENIDFLKHLYGEGGSSHTVSGSGIGEMHNAKGITFNRGYFDKSAREQLFKWNYIEKRIKELIKVDRYFNKKEQEEYPKWLEKQEQARILSNAEEKVANIPVKTQEDELAERVYSFIKPFDLYNYTDDSRALNTDQDNIEIVKSDINDDKNVIDYVNALRKVIEDFDSTNPQKHEAEVLLSILEKRVPHYEYHLGDTVYIGADEYEIASIDSNTITLFDPKFPLFNKEMNIDEFERKMQENYSNEHLITKSNISLPENNKIEQKENLQVVLEDLYKKYNLSEEFEYEFIFDKNNEIESIIINQDKDFIIYDFMRIISSSLELNISKEDKIRLEKQIEYVKEKERNYIVGKEIDDPLLDGLYVAKEIEEIEDSSDMVILERISDKHITKQAISRIHYIIQEQEEKNKKPNIEEIRQEDSKIESETNLPKIDLKPTKRKNKIQDFILHPEVAEQDRNNYKITNNELGVGTPRQKFARNIEAIKVLKKCETENRYATQEEQEILSQYVGWGGLQQAFDEHNSSWTDEYNILKELLDEEEYRQARSSTLTAFYTPPLVINAIYKTLQNMGLKEGNILEPSCGVGNFFGMLPTELQNCKMYGIEIDNITGRIAQQLYQKSTIAVQGYEKVDLPDSFFDVAVGNVPFRRL